MKCRRFVSLLLVFVFIISMSLTTSAVSPRGLSIDSSLCFEGTTAQCAVNVSGDHITDSISATIKLYKGNTCIRTWVRSASGFLNFYQEVAAVKNVEYRLEAHVTVNGVKKPVFTVTNTCK